MNWLRLKTTSNCLVPNVLCPFILMRTMQMGIYKFCCKFDQILFCQLFPPKNTNCSVRMIFLSLLWMNGHQVWLKSSSLWPLIPWMIDPQSKLPLVLMCVSLGSTESVHRHLFTVTVLSGIVLSIESWDVKFINDKIDNELITNRVLLYFFHNMTAPCVCQW